MTQQDLAEKGCTHDETKTLEVDDLPDKVRVVDLCDHSSYNHRGRDRYGEPLEAEEKRLPRGQSVVDPVPELHRFTPRDPRGRNLARQEEPVGERIPGSMCLRGR